MKNYAFSLPPLMLFGLLFIFGSAEAVPGQMNVQGRLLNGNVAMTGSHSATFRICDDPAAGSVLWSESNSLTVQGGIFTAVIGAVTPIPSSIFDSESRWLEVTVDGTTLSPRLQLTTSAYAFNAQHADTADFALDAAASSGNLWSTDGTNVWRSAGKVGIGTPTPTEVLQLESISGTSSALLRSYVPGIGSYGAIQFQNTLATSAGVAAQIEALRPVATWGQESDLLFSTNPGSANPSLRERMRITKDGNVGIGTARPLDQLEVAGNVTIGPYDGTFDDVILRAAGGCPNCGGNSEGGSNLILRSGIGTGVGPSGDIVFQVSDNANFGNQQPHGVLEAMRIQTTTGNVSISGNLTVTGTKCRVVRDAAGGDLYFNAVESAAALFSIDGQSTMCSGVARVVLDPKWLAGVTIDDEYPMQVWITFYGPHGDYYVQRARTHDGFTVVDSSGSSVQFGWKVEARQKGYEHVFLDQPSSVAKQ